ncbi:MAG: hypothetical protein RL226_1289, partial [Bacteroidota bacterium]
DVIGFPVCFFIRPKVVAERLDGRWTVLQGEISPSELEKMERMFIDKGNPAVTMRPQTGHEEYLRQFNKIQDHIHRGDIYELNYCISFHAQGAAIDPRSVYARLRSRTEAPFSAFVQLGDRYLLCASPERYIQRKGNRVISQPIKGTAKRSIDPEEDQRIAESLRNNQKERSENIMITDLVRNDLSKSAIPGTVEVDELCGIYSFRTVHQMISTISAQFEEDVDAVQLLGDTFPMGSMTGAPKVRAMEIIDLVENHARGLYSGSVGYIEPNGNFDFNVVIRSLLYNSKTQYLSAQVGSAITSGSEGEAEYKECLLKAEALLKALNDD